MDQAILNDKDQFPTEEIIFSHIGRSKIVWESVFTYIRMNHPDFSVQWKFYNDGKSWLLKVAKKSKTIFWLSILRGSFRITFYFGDKAEKLISGSAIPEDLKSQFKEGKRFGKIRGLTLLMKSKNQVVFVKELISIKLLTK